MKYRMKAYKTHKNFKTLIKQALNTPLNTNQKHVENS